LNKKTAIIVFLFLGIFRAQSQSDHFLHCLKVIDNNDIELSWDDDTDLLLFVNYEIYHSNLAASGFALIASIGDIAVISYLHQNVDPATKDNFYFVKINFSGIPAKYSDTLQTLKLRVIPQVSNSLARLDWNVLHTPALPSYSEYFYVFRKYSFDNWELIDSTKSLLYTDTISVCFDSINYKIQQKDNLACVSESNIAGAWLNDLTQPPVPIFDSVSIGPAGLSVMGWQVNPDPGTVSYIVYKNNDGTWHPLDTIHGRQNTFYLDQNSTPCRHTQSYSLAAMDSCGNTSAFGISPQQESDSLRTVHLKEIQFNPCLNRNLLRWTKYINMRNDLAGYEIWAKRDTENIVLLDFVSADVNFYEEFDLLTGSTYQYFIKAVNVPRNISSSSCTKSITTYYPDLPAFIYLQNATVLNNDSIQLTIQADTSVSTQGYKILRSESPYGPFDTIEIIYSNSSDVLFFTDVNVEVMQSNYYYQIVVQDSCSKDDLFSNPAGNILLQIESPSTNNYTLSWNEYEEWGFPVEKYDLYRLLSGGSVQFVSSINPSTLTATIVADDLDQAYFVEAVEENIINQDLADTSRSNFAFIQREAEIFLPNAFNPKGINPFFKPVLKFAESGDYQLIIMNRWGQKMFETRDLSQGWDGRFQNQFVPVGTYVCIISYRDARLDFQKKTLLTVVY
jgi:CHU_C Type IX secretion signal domain